MAGSAADELFQSYRPVFADRHGVTVSLRRGAEVTSNVTAVRGQTEAETEGEEGFDVRQEPGDWFIDKADYAIGGSEVEPAQGDEILWAVGGETRIYLVTEEGARSRWQWADRAETRYMIHTKFHGTE